MQDFDFSAVAALFHPYLDTEHPAYNPDIDPKTIMDICTALPLFDEYAAFFLAQEFTDEYPENTIKEAILPSTAPVNIHTEGVYNTFSSAASPHKNKTTDFPLGVSSPYGTAKEIALPSKPVRKANVYPLTHDETERALDFIEDNSDFLYAMINLKELISTYLYYSRKKLEEQFDLYPTQSTPSQKTIRSELDSLRLNANGLSITHDLAPLFAHYLSHQETPFTPQNLRGALRDAFVRQAFESYEQTSKGYRKCPFSHPLVRILCLGFEHNEDGTLHPMRTEDPSTLLLFMRNRVREKFFTSLRPV
jgi:hypothetical protein